MTPFRPFRVSRGFALTSLLVLLLVLTVIAVVVTAVMRVAVDPGWCIPGLETLTWSIGRIDLMGLGPAWQSVNDVLATVRSR